MTMRVRNALLSFLVGMIGGFTMAGAVNWRFFAAAGVMAVVAIIIAVATEGAYE